MRLRTWFAALSAVLLVASIESGAQRLAYNSGQTIAPAYEGWERNEDGSFNLMFGYMNQNWEYNWLVRTIFNDTIKFINS